MAIYTTYFVGTHAQIASAIPASRPPLASPVRATRMNPFTKQEVEYLSWDPADAPGAAVEQTPPLDGATIPRRSVIVIEGDYMQYLEERLPAGVRALPHFAWKSMDSIVLGTLAELLGLYPDQDAFDRAHPNLRFLDDAALNEVPRSLVDAVAALEDCREVAERWVEDETLEGSSADDVLPFLEALRALSKQCPNDRKMALLTEW